MKKLPSALIAAVVLVAGCGGDGSNPLTGGSTSGGGGGGGGGGGSAIPSELSQDLRAAEFNPNTNRLVLRINGMDAPNSTATFIRDATLDVASADGTTNYRAFRVQTTSDNRYYLALFAAGDDVTTGGVTTEPQFNSYFGGATYTKSSSANLPTTGSAIFHSGYAGVISEQDPNGADRPTRTSGEAFLSVNLTEKKVEGEIRNRLNVEDSSALTTAIMRLTTLEGDEFLGNVFIGSTNAGDYGGVISGNIANSEPGSTTGRSPGEVAGVLVFDPYGTSGLTEYGSFIAPVCGGPNASANCP
ncbi:MAG: hypothetical protein WBN04_15045 [Paracoccaceae bacterium]